MRIVYLERLDGTLIGVNPDLVRMLVQAPGREQTSVYFDKEHYVLVKKSAVDLGALLTG